MRNLNSKIYVSQRRKQLKFFEKYDWRKILLCFCVIIGVIWSGVLIWQDFSRRKTIENIEKNYFRDSKYNGVSSKFIERKNEFEDTLLEIPVTKIEKIDRIMESKTTEIDHSFRESLKNHNDFNQLRTHRMGYQVYYNTADFISILVSSHQDTQGAHSIRENVFWTFDKKTAETVKLNQILSGENNESKMLEYLKNQIKKSLDLKKIDYQKDIVDEIKLTDFENFIVIDKKTMNFAFSSAKILPHSFGEISINVKIDEIKDVLQNELARKIFDVPQPPAPAPEPKVTPPAPITSNPNSKCDRCIALTFDDGPRADTTPIALEHLRNHKARATFFMLGPNVQRNPDLARRIVSEGHQIGNHSWTHVDFTIVDAQRIRNEINQTNDVIKSITGISPNILRQPYGSTNAAVQNELRNTGMASILWSVDTRDWADRNSSIVCNRAVSSAHTGAIILMHDIHRTTVDALPCILSGLSSKGYRFVTVAEILGAVNPGEIYRAGNSL